MKRLFHRIDRGVLVNAVFVAVAALISYQFTIMRFTMNMEYERATLQALLQGSAALPFQYRALVPWLVRILADVVPPIHIPQQMSVLASVSVPQARAFVVIECASLFALLLVFRAYLSTLLKDAVLGAVLSFVLVYALTFNFLLSRYAPFWYPSDIPSVLFFTLGLWLLYREKWVLYYIVFAAATFNRETTCFLTMVFLVTAYRKRPPGSILIHCAAQFAVWMGAKYLLFMLYGGNPGEGSLAEAHGDRNLEYILNPKFYPLLMSTMGYLWIPVAIFYRRIQDQFVKKSLLVVIPFVAIEVFTSSIAELRVYQELIPVVVSAFLLILMELMRRGGGNRALAGVAPPGGRA